MPAPVDVIDLLESITDIYLSAARHRERAAFILSDELVELACKSKAIEHNPNANIRNMDFEACCAAPGVVLPNSGLGAQVIASHRVRNDLHHRTAALAVDDQRCADAIADTIDVVEFLWPGATNGPNYLKLRCAARIIRLYSSHGNSADRESFEMQMSLAEWRVLEREQHKNEGLIRPWLRRNWLFALSANIGIVEEILNSM